MMNKFLIILYFLPLFNVIGCSNQSIPTENIASEKGVLLYYMNQPYFFPTSDTSIEKISRANILGVKLANIDLNDIYDSISHKHNVIIYAAGDGKRIDTVKSKVGTLKVWLQTKPTKTMLSTDTAAFSFFYKREEWVFRYKIRFDMQVLSVTPILPSDIKALKLFLSRL